MVAGVKIVATPKGVKVEGDGFTGQSCSLDVARILRAMDLSPEEAQPKPEFFLHDQSSQHSRNHQENSQKS